LFYLKKPGVSEEHSVRDSISSFGKSIFEFSDVKDVHEALKTPEKLDMRLESSAVPNVKGSDMRKPNNQVELSMLFKRSTVSTVGESDITSPITSRPECTVPDIRYIHIEDTSTTNFNGLKGEFISFSHSSSLV
jgi:hypothetical protein